MTRNSPGFVVSSADLAALARAHGVDTSYTAWDGTRVEIAASVIVDVLASLGVAAHTPGLVRSALARARAAARAPLPACVVARAGRPTVLQVPAAAPMWIELEHGGRLAVPEGGQRGRTLPATLPLGYHRLHLQVGERTAQAPLISAPESIRTVRTRSWGFTVQLYSALSERSWGMGDLADLAALAQWSGRTLDAGFVLVNPLHTMLPAAYAGHSPYWPSSRRYADPVHIRVEDVPEFAYAAEAERHRIEELVEAGAALREGVLDGSALIDRDAVWDAKREALALLHRVAREPARDTALAAFVRREGARLTDYATYAALARRHGPDWRHWPVALRDPRGVEVARKRAELHEEVTFQRWLAWTVDEQLQSAQRTARDAGMAVGIIHDLAVGAHPGGADAWAFQEFLAAGVTVGAPPDAFTAQGQDWQQPPWHPGRLAAAGYAPVAELLRGVLRHAGALRMDHVLGLFRLWWVPLGRDLREGAYVRYDHEAMLAVLALEADRADACVIGEDLGTVAPGVREFLADHNVLGTSVLWFERDSAGGPLPAADWREGCLATVTTHDLPSTAARLDGSHVELRHQHGMLGRPLEEERRAAAVEVDGWRKELARLGLPTAGPVAGSATGHVTPGEPASDCIGLHAFLARTPALLLGASLPDAVGDVRPQNLPGTFDEHPNWQHVIADGEGLPVTLEGLAAAPGPRRLAAALRMHRPGVQSPAVGRTCH